MGAKKMIRSSLPLGPSFPGGPYEKGVEKAVDVSILSNPIIKGLIQSGDIVVIDASMRKVKETANLEKEMAELQRQLKEAQDKLASMQDEPVEKKVKKTPKKATTEDESVEEKKTEEPVKLTLGKLGKI